MTDGESPLKTDEHLVALHGMWDEMKVLGRKIDGTREELSGRIDSLRAEMSAVRTDLSERIDALRTEVEGLRGEMRRSLAET